MKKLFTLLIMLLAVAVNGMAANYYDQGCSEKATDYFKMYKQTNTASYTYAWYACGQGA